MIGDAGTAHGFSGCGVPSDPPQHSAPDAQPCTGRSPAQIAGLLAGPVLLVVLTVSPTWATFLDHTARFMHLAGDHPDVVEVAAGCQSTLAVLVLMVIWWVTEAVPTAVTALLPGLLLPLLHVTGVRDHALVAFDARVSFAAFASPVIYLFLAGFLLAGAMRKTGLDRRITLTILSRPFMMRGPATIMFGVMFICAFLSMWISNTATAAMMLPIAVAILAELGEEPGRSRFGVALLLGVAWSCSIGGLATLIGTPPNGIVVEILDQQHLARIDFVDWMKIAAPASVVGLVAAWALLWVIYRPKVRDTSDAIVAVRRHRQRMGRMTTDEIATVAVFVAVVALWVSHPFWNRLLPEGLYQRVERFNIYEIGLLGALVLFALPVHSATWRPVLVWRDARYVDWGTLILFGGGIAISNAMFATGLTDWLATQFVGRIGQPAPWVCLVLVVLLIDFLTEITSNTAVTTMMTPVLAGLAPQLGLAPVTLCVAAAMASSLAFMLPVATPPNAIVYSSGYFSIGQMARAGLLMNLVGCAVLLGSVYLVSVRLLHALAM